MIWGEYYNSIIVLGGSILLSAVSGLTGVFAFIRKKSLTGDLVAHSVLPGIILAFIFFQSRNPIVLLFGALISGGISIFFSDFLVRTCKLKEDSALAMTMTFFFAIGVFFMQQLQNDGTLSQAGLSDFLFGKAAALSLEDLWWLSSAAALILVVLFLFYRSILVFSFSESFARVSGLPVSFLQIVLSIVLVWNISISLQTTGIAMSAALMITPAAASRFWTDSLKGMFVLSAIFGAIAGFVGAFISISFSNMPTGPWIVMILTGIALFSFLFSPKGRVVKWNNERATQRRLALENLIKNLYKMTEDVESNAVETKTLKLFYKPGSKEWKNGLKSAIKDHYVWVEENQIILSDKGKIYASRIVRGHRLWELYISTFARIPDEWVHADAELFEHFIGNMEQKELYLALNQPSEDPHNKPIPPYE